MDSTINDFTFLRFVYNIHYLFLRRRLNMSYSKFHKNCIITGPLDGYCLVCGDHMRSEDEYRTHIEKPVHKKNLETTLYAEEFQHNCIRKVKKEYYCEVCNLLFHRPGKVHLHVAERQHIYNKNVNLLRRTDNDKHMIVFNNTLIEDIAWNGFVGTSCCVCNTEFEDMLIHKTEQDHLLKLIQKPVEFGEENSVYRMVDDSSFQCLTCNEELRKDSLSTHFSTDIHKQKLKVVSSAAEKTSELEQETPTQIIVESNGKQANIKKEVTTELDKDQPKSVVVENAKQSDSKSKEVNIQVSSAKGPDRPQKPKQNIDGNVSKVADEKDDKKPTKSKSTNMDDPIEMDKYICNVLKATDYIVGEGGRFLCLLCDWNIDVIGIAMHLNSRHHSYMLRLHKMRLERRSKERNDAQAKECKPEKLQSFKVACDRESKVQVPEPKCTKVANIVSDVVRNAENKIKKELNATNPITFIEPVVKTQNKETVKSQTLAETLTEAKPVVKENEVVKEKEQETKAKSQAKHVVKCDEQIANFAKDNNMTYIDGTVSCLLCESKLSPSMKYLKEHVEGAQHKMRTKTTANSDVLQNIKRVPMNVFITSLVGIKTYLLNGVVINEKYDINILSFLMITVRDNELRCELCKDTLTLQEVQAHKVSNSHMKAMKDTMVLVASSGPLENEFIREPQPGVYHCGFCSSVFPDWAALSAHLSSGEHREAKTAAAWRLRERASDIARNKWQDVDRNLLGYTIGKLKMHDEDYNWLQS